MNVVFVSSEVTPFASTGGLAEVAAALPKALAARGANVTRIMPMYRQVLEGPNQLVDMKMSMDIPVGFHTRRADVWRCDAISPPIYFIRRDEYFDRRFLYGNPDRDYDDSFERFVFFQKAAVMLIDRLGLQADIVHLNDWQTGLIPYYLTHGVVGTGRQRREKVVFTIHNLAYQGIFTGNDYSVTNLPFSCFNIGTLEYYGNINCMKGGIAGADAITTVSDSYAQEIQAPGAGCGLEGVLAEARGRLIGIVNGIDNQLWNPADDHLIVSRYSASDPSGKSEYKKKLLRTLRISTDLKVPVIGMITRLVEQKGLDLLAEALPEIMKRDVAFVLLVTGSERYETLCKNAMRHWPGRFSCTIAYDASLAHRIFAGTDLFLMPSRFEPCGLNQLYALRYGSLPIVHGVGGLRDTVVDLRENPASGNGWMFREYTKAALLDAMDAGIKACGDAAVWPALTKRVMALDFSWDRASEKYLEVYRRLTG